MQVVVVRMLADRRDELGMTRTAVVSRPHRLSLELVPGGTQTFLSVIQARAVLARSRRVRATKRSVVVRARGVPGSRRLQLKQPGRNNSLHI